MKLSLSHVIIFLSCIALCIAGCASSTNAPIVEPTIKGVDATHAGLLVHVVDDATGQPIHNSASVFIRSIHGEADWNRIADDFKGNQTFLLSDSGVHSLLIASNAAYLEQTHYARQDTIHVQFGHSVEITERLKAFPVSGAPNYDDSVIACYRFSGNAIDSSKNHHDGLLHGCTFDTDRFGRPSSALRLENDTDFVSVPDAPDLNFGISENFTIVFWCTLTDAELFDQGQDVYFVHKGVPGKEYAAVRSYCGVSGKIATSKGQFEGCGDYPVSNDQWEFYAVEFNRVGTITEYYYYYKDQETSHMVWDDDLSWDSLSTAAPLCIGGVGDYNHAYKGRIDDVRIYKGLLPPTYLDSLYHEGGWK